MPRFERKNRARSIGCVVLDAFDGVHWRFYLDLIHADWLKVNCCKGSRRSPDKFDLPEDNIYAKPSGNVRPRTFKPNYERSDSRESGSSTPRRLGSYSDRSDSSSDLQISPRASRSSSKGSLNSDDLTVSGPVRARRPPKGYHPYTGGRSLIESCILEEPEDENEDINEQFFIDFNQIQDKSKSSLSTSGSTNGTGAARRRSSPRNQKVQIRPRGPATNNPGDQELLQVKLPAASGSDGPGVIRRRGAAPQSQQLGRSFPQRPSTANNLTGNDEDSLNLPSAPGRSGLPRPRSSLPQPRKANSELPVPRRSLGGNVKPRRNQSPDVVPRRAVSQETSVRRSHSPDIIPRGSRRSDVSPRGQLGGKNWQGGEY